MALAAYWSVEEQGTGIAAAALSVARDLSERTVATIPAACFHTSYTFPYVIGR